MSSSAETFFCRAQKHFFFEHKDDLPEEVLRMLGIFKNWEEYVAYYLFEDLQMDKILTKSDRKAIINGADFAKVYQRREALIEQSV